MMEEQSVESGISCWMLLLMLLLSAVLSGEQLRLLTAEVGQLSSGLLLSDGASEQMDIRAMASSWRLLSLCRKTRFLTGLSRTSSIRWASSSFFSPGFSWAASLSSSCSEWSDELLLDLTPESDDFLSSMMSEMKLFPLAKRPRSDSAAQGSSLRSGVASVSSSPESSSSLGMLW